MSDDAWADIPSFEQIAAIAKRREAEAKIERRMSVIGAIRYLMTNESDVKRLSKGDVVRIAGYGQEVTYLAWDENQEEVREQLKARGFKIVLLGSNGPHIKKA